jgi:hypothetical protein
MRWTVDAANHLTEVQIGGGVQATVASASITDLWSTPSSSVSASGTTTITQFANGDAVPGSLKIVTFQGVLTLTQGGGIGGAPLNLPNGGANITTAAGDYAVVLALTSTNAQVVFYQRATGAALSSVGLSVGAASLANSALASIEQPINLSLSVSVAGNQLAISALTAAGGTPSSTSPILAAFRSQTQNSGAPIFASIQTSPSFTIGTGNSMGCTTAVLCRLWVELICQTESAGVCTSVLLGASVQSGVVSGGNVCSSLLESILQTTGSGTSGGSTLGTIYTSVSAISGKAIKIIGFVEATWVSGTGWSVASTNYLHLLSPGGKKPCDMVQMVSGTGSQSIVPSSAVDLVRVEATIPSAGTATTPVTALLRRGTASGTPIGANVNFSTSPSITVTNYPFYLHVVDNPATASSQQYSVSFTGMGSSTYFMSLWEIMGALESANDDALALPKVA